MVLVRMLKLLDAPTVAMITTKSRICDFEKEAENAERCGGRSTGDVS